jgi:hypothetical protein
VGRQVRGWLDSLQNSEIRGQRHLNEKSRAVYEEGRRAEAFGERMAVFRARMAEGLRNGTWGKGGREEAVAALKGGREGEDGEGEK